MPPFSRILLNRTAPPFPQPSPPQNQPENRHKSQPAPNNSKQQKRELVSNPIAQIHHIERESEAECLPDEVEKLSDVVALLAVAVRRVGVAGRGDDLEAESRYACKDVIIACLDYNSKSRLEVWVGLEKVRRVTHSY